MELITGLFDTSGFPARWRCGNWTPAHGWLHILSDMGVWAAYFAIPLVLGSFVARRRDLPFRRVLLLFVAFILLCGTTHLMDAVIFWWPAYRLAGVLKLLTAVVSWVTVLALVRVAPAVLAMRTPEELEREVAARTDAEFRLREANAELERRVEERTADLGRSVAALQRERELLRTTLMSIGDGAVTTDRDGNVTGLNGVAESMTGWTNAEAQGRPFDAVFRIVNEKTRLPVENPVLRALSEGVNVGLANHSVLIAKDGTERPIEDSAAPIRSTSGEVVGSVLVFRDVTERRAAEARVQAERDRVQLVADAVPALMSYIDADARYRLNNHAYETWFGHPRGELVGRHMRDVLGEAAWTAIRPHVEAALAGRAVTYEAEVPYRDGGPRWILATYTPDVSGDGAVRGVVAHVSDITALKRAEQQIATTLESVTDGFMRYDRDWRIVYANAEAERINQLSRSQMLGRIVWEVFPAVVGTTLEAELLRAVREQVTVEFENFYKPFGRWYSLKGYPAADGGLITFIRDITEQKHHQQALAASEARLRRVFESNVVGMIRWDLDRSLILDANDNFLQMSGYTRDDVVAGRLNFRDMTPAEWTPRNEEGIRTLRAEGHAAPYEKEYFRKDGSRVPLLIAGTRFEDSPTEGMSLIIDISDRKRAEDEIARLAAESERQRRVYETVLTNTPDFMYVFSLDHRVVYANEALIRMWGRGRDGAIGKTFLEIGYEPWHAEMHDREIDTVRATKQPIRGEVPFTGTLGQRQYDYIFVPVLGADGEVEAVAGTTRDVTERQEAERQLRESEERRRLALDAAELGAWHIDPATNALTTDERFRIIFAGTADPMDYEQAFAAVHPDDRERIREAVAAATRSGTPYAEEYRVIHPDGSVRWVFGKGRANYDRELPKRLVSFDGTVADITARKRIEEERERLVGQLRVQDRRKDEFLATLAHELRNPLAPIRNGLQVIRLAGATGTVEQARSMMERQLGQMVRLVDDLLDVSRVATGKLQLRKERIELRAVIAASLETSRPVIEQAGHDLSVVVPDEPIFVEADLTRLDQVVSNMLTNSAKYTHQGGLIRLSVERHGDTAVIAVKDTGIGIPPAMLDKVFEMFIQVDRTLEKTTGGLGIGLSLVKGLVEMHGGTIEARSDGEGRGSEFVVRLPVASPAPALSDGSDKRGEGVVSSGRRRILVVDDNVDSADSLGQLLEMLGNEVRTAYDGEAGIAAAEAFRPAVVLCDIGMPKVNGYDAARRIRGEFWGKDMVLVALTGWGQQDDRRKSTEAGFDQHLVKPVEAAALMKLLAELPTATT